MPLPERFRPIYRITVKNAEDGKEYEFNSWYYMIDGTKIRSLNKLTIYVDRDLNVPLDMFRIRITTRSGSLRDADQGILKAEDIKTGATVKIYLGYDTDSEGSMKLWRKHLVFTGLVDEVSQDFKNIVITGYSNAYKIIFKKPEAFKEGEASDKDSKTIVGKLLSKMVATDESFFSKGMTFHSYVPNTKESIYNNVQLLAEYNGFDLYFSKEGKLRFCEKNAGNKGLKYAEDIIDNSITMARPPYDTVTVYVCHEANKGDDANVWQLTSKPLEGAKSIGNNKVEVLQRQSAIIKDLAQAKDAAKNKLAKLYTPESGQVTILGSPELELGQSLTLKFAERYGKNAPGAKELDYMARADVRITRITHKFNMRSGFVTILGWVKPPDLSSKTPVNVGNVTKMQRISEEPVFGKEGIAEK